MRICALPAVIVKCWVLALLLPGLSCLENSTEPTLLGLNVSSVTSAFCVDSFSDSVQGLFTADCTNSTPQRSALEKLIRKEFVPCLNAAETSAALDVRLIATEISAMPGANFTTQTLEQLANQFNNASPLPYRIEFNFLPARAWNRLVEEVLSQTSNNLTSTAHTAFLYNGNQVPTFAINGAMADLSSLVLEDGDDLNWLDILPFVRQQMATYNGKLVGIPLDMRVNLIFYREDVLTALNLTRPATYDDLVQLAAKVNGTRMGPEGEPMWALCQPYLGDAGNCSTAHNFFWDVLAPYVQVFGPTDGMAVDPRGTGDLRILFDSEAGTQAMEIISKLIKYMLPEAGCNSQFSEEFTQGKCIITFGRVAQFKADQRSNSSTVRGKTRAYPCPGSDRVLDRKTMRLVPCTNITCPYARYERLLNGSTVLVNNAPFAPGVGYAAAVSSIVPKASKLATFRYLSYVAGSEAINEAVMDPNTFFGPFRTSQFVLDTWVAHGYEPNATKQFLETSRQLLSSNYPNLALPPNFVFFSTEMVTHIQNLFMQLLAEEITPQVMLQHIISKWRWWFQQWGQEEARRQLRLALGWDLPASPPEPEAPPPSSKADRSMEWRTAVISACVLGVMLLVFMTTGMLYYRSRRQGMGLFGTVLPPREGPATTLLVTDMQDSTSLWEQLPQDVMDGVLKVHHNTLRGLLTHHRGYESSTEGDSFILAFHDPQSALSYALEAQQALLKAEWPQALLSHPGCKPVYMKPMSSDPLDMHLEQNGGHSDEFDAARTVVLNMRDRRKARRPAEQTITTMETGRWHFSDMCRHAWAPVNLAEAQAGSHLAVLAFRGVRVRMGLVAGVTAGAVVHDKVDDRRTHYTGSCLELAKLVADCGAGGTVSVSETAYNLLPMETLWKDVRLWHAGCHVLADDLLPMHVYQVLPCGLSCRAWSLAPLRSVRQVEVGTMEAPVGTLAIGFMKVVGLDTLKRWNPGKTVEAVALWQALVLARLQQYGGYAAEAKEDLLLVAFRNVSAVLLWAKCCVKELLAADWSEELLGHEMGEEVSVLVGSQRDGEWHNKVMMRGLRIKVGVDWGSVLCSVSPMTGKMSYRGRLMNRAARIACKASPGQVLTTSYAWSSVDDSTPLLAVPLGAIRLKGIQEDIQLIQIKLNHPTNESRVGNGDAVLALTPTHASDTH